MMGTLVVMELCRSSFKNILNQIMRNSAYLQKGINSASIKTLHTKLLSSRLMFNNLTKLTKKSFCMDEKKINIKGSVSFQ